MWIDKLHGVSYRWYSKPKEVPLLDMANATRYIKALQVGKAYVGMVFGDLSLLALLFRTGIKFQR